MNALLEQIEKNRQNDKKFEKKQRNEVFKNHYNEENPKRFKAMIREKKK